MITQLETSSGANREPIRSIESGAGKISLLLRCGDLDVLLVEVGVHGVLSDTSLCGGASWHLPVEGRARLEQGNQAWDVLPSRCLALAGPSPYRVVNPGEEPLRLLSVVVGAAAAERQTSARAS